MRAKSKPFYAFAALITMLTLLVTPAIAADKQTVKIGVLAKRGKEHCIAKWEPTAKYLARKIPEYNFMIVPLDFEEIRPAVKAQKIDLILSNSSFYVGLEYAHQTSRLATLKNLRLGKPYTIFAGTIFCRADSKNIQNLDNLRGKRFMAVKKTSFGGWQMAWRLLNARGIVPDRHFASLEFGGTHDAVVYAVRDGKVDAGAIRSDTLERMAHEGNIRLDDFRVIEAHSCIGGDTFPFLHSTRHYPEWPMAKLQHTSNILAEKVAIALIGMPHNDLAARAARCAGWTVPGNYQPVHECLKEIRFFPYENYGKITFRNVLSQHRYLSAGIFTCVIIMALTTAHIIRLNRRIIKAHDKNDILLSAITSILISIDENGTITQWNAAAEETFGIAAADTVGQPISDCGVEWESARLTPAMVKCQATQKPIRVDDVKFKYQDGTNGFLCFTLTPMKEHRNMPPAYLVNATDITKRKIMESQLVQAQKLESIGQLAAGIAHEINTPTQYVGDNTRFLKECFEDVFRLHTTFQKLLDAAGNGPIPQELLAEVAAATRETDIEYLSQEIPKAIEQSLDGIKRVSKIVHAMKEFSHPGSQDKTTVDLNIEIENTITVCENEWKYVADVVTDFAPDLPPLLCLPGDLNQVFLNMIVNAAHAIANVLGDNSAKKGTITISTGRNNGSIEVRITDTGTGIPENLRTRVFDPFFTTKEIGKGTGQGLAIAHSVVVDKHSGTITLESETGKGTTFIIHLPLDTKVTPAKPPAKIK